jgi:hypothetical protein
MLYFFRISIGYKRKMKDFARKKVFTFSKTEKSQVLDLCELWLSSCEVMKICNLEAIQILKMVVTFLLLKIFT